MLCVLQLCVHLTISGCPTFPGIPLQLATSNLEIGHLSPAYLKIKVKALPQIVWQFDFLAWDRKCRSPLIIDLYSAIYTICLLGYIQLVLDQKLHIHIQKWKDNSIIVDIIESWSSIITTFITWYLSVSMLKAKTFLADRPCQRWSLTYPAVTQIRLSFLGTTSQPAMDTLHENRMLEC